MRARPHETLSHRPYSLLALLAILVAVSLTYHVRDTIDRVEDIRHGARHARDPFDPNLPEMQVTAVAPEAREAGLAPRDLLTGIDGMPIPGVVHLYARLRAAVPGDRLNLQVGPTGGRSPGKCRSSSGPCEPVRRRSLTRSSQARRSTMT